MAPLEFLNKIAGTAITPVAENPDTEIEFASIPEGDRKEQIEMLLAWLDENGVKPKGFSRNEGKRFTCINLPHCLVKGAEHSTPGRAGILVYDDGRIGYKCFSAGCNEKGWAAAQEKLGSYAVFCGKHYEKTDRHFDDPIRLAQKHIAKTATPDGTPTFAHFWNETHRHTSDGWEQLAPGEESAWVRETIQKENDGLAIFLTKQTGESVKPESVSSAQVRETTAAIESICKHRISKKTQAPLWLSPYGDWGANDVLIFPNGFFNLRHWLDGKEFFIPATPKLFYEYQATFDYVAAPTPPTAWLDFLKSLNQKKDWYLQLQQFMGYLLWPGYDLQKFFHFFGPPRSGKGTIAQVAADMGGGACALTLDDFCDPFGKEKAIGQRVILVSETEKGPTQNQESAVVGVIKTMTGGGEVSVNRKHIKNISLRLPGKIVMQGNAPFTLSDNSGALMGRCIPFRLTESFLHKEDSTLAEKLKAEYPGIFLWCLEGLKSLYEAKRFTLCESTESELEQTRDIATPLQTFLDDCCIIDPAQAVHCKSLFRIYELWLEDEDVLSAGNDKQFGAELRTAIPAIDRKRLTSKDDTHCNGSKIVKTDSSRPWAYTGIAPKSERCKVNFNC
jgi:putative DNA primase/helicase